MAEILAIAREIEPSVIRALPAIRGYSRRIMSELGYATDVRAGWRQMAAIPNGAGHR
jgi:hypothetical protein